MAAPSQAIAPTDADMLQAQADIWRHSLYYLTSMVLKCAVELHIPTAIHDLGGSTTQPDLVTALSLPKTKLPFLGRIMRLLVTSGFFASDGSSGDGAEAVYRLNPLSSLLALQETGSLPTAIFFANCFFRHSAKRSLCQLEFPAVGKAGFADCQAVGKELQSAKAGHG